MVSEALRAAAKRQMPPTGLLLYRMWKKRNLRDTASAARFLATPLAMASLPARLRVLQRIYAANAIRCEHTQDEILQVIGAVLDFPPSVPGCVVEAGCFKGGSTAKFSIAAKVASRKLFVFDSFEGLPANDERYQVTIFGQRTDFAPGEYTGALEEVQRNVATYGEGDVCNYRKGWFDATMPGFTEPIIAGYIDVDLASSTKTCLKYLYPMLQPGGCLFSQDAHLPLIIELLDDANFWQTEVGCAKPTIEGLGKKKLVCIRKPAGAA
jgi:O-methyltransferase